MERPGSIELMQAASRTIWCYSTTLFCASGLKEEFIPSGSATFVLVDGRPALLTAAHVWERVRSTDIHAQIAFAVGNGHESVTINTIVLKELYCSPKPFKWSVEGPDIAIVEIPERDAGRLRAAGKAFYDLSRRAKDPAPREDRVGAWVVVGAPSEWMQTSGERQADGAQRVEADLTVVARADVRTGALPSGFDSVDLWLGEGGDPLNSYEGLSGAGLWSVGDREDSEKLSWDGHSVTLTGVTFYHSADDPEGQFLRCHGHASIYCRALAGVVA